MSIHPILCLQAEQGGNPSQLQRLVGWQPCSSSSPSTTLCPTWKTSGGSASAFTFFPALVVSLVPQDNTAIEAHACSLDCAVPTPGCCLCPLPTTAFPTEKLMPEPLLPLRRHQNPPVPREPVVPRCLPQLSAGVGLVSPPLASHSLGAVSPQPQHPSASQDEVEQAAGLEAAGQVAERRFPAPLSFSCFQLYQPWVFLRI